MKLKLTPKEYSLSEAFGPELPGNQTVTGYEHEGYEFVPRKDPDWRWDRTLLRDLIVWWKEGGSEPVYLFGPTGAGKSSAIVNFCAALGLPLYERTIYEGLEFSELVTQIDLVDGTTLPNYGLLPLAMGVTGYPGVFCANEVDRAEAGLLAGLYEVLEGRPLVTPIGGAELVTPLAGFRMAATGNTTLLGDRTGLYVGAKQQDIALQDRFWKLKVEYLEAEAEEALLADLAPHLPEKLRRLMVDVANEIREVFMGNSDSARALPLTMSTRTLARWARMTWSFRGAQQANLSPVYYALDRAFLNAADSDPEVRQAIKVIVHGKLGDEQGVPND